MWSVTLFPLFVWEAINIQKQTLVGESCIFSAMGCNRMNFQLRKFNIDMIKDRCDIDSRKSPMIVVIGKKDTGKSFLVRDILYNVQSLFPVGTVISATEAVNEFFQSMVPSKLIHDEYKPDIVKNVIKRQMNVKSTRNKDKLSKGGNSNIDPRAQPVSFRRF
jgi:hypothetical protein